MSHRDCCIVCGFLQSFGYCCSLFVLKSVRMFSACTCCPVNIAATRVYMLPCELCCNTGVHAVLWTLLQHKCTCCPVNIAATQVYMLCCEYCCNTGVHAVLWTLQQHGCICCPVNIAATQVSMLPCEHCCTQTQVYMLPCEHCCNTGFDYGAKFAWIVKFCTTNVVWQQTYVLMYDDPCMIKSVRMYLW